MPSTSSPDAVRQPQPHPARRLHDAAVPAGPGIGPYGCHTCRRSRSSSSRERSRVRHWARGPFRHLGGVPRRDPYGVSGLLRPEPAAAEPHTPPPLVGPAAGAPSTVPDSAAPGLRIRAAAPAGRARCSGSVTVVCALHLEPGVRDHVEVGLARLALAGEVVAEEDRVGQVQGERLQGAQMDLAAARDADLGVRADEADHRQDAQTALRGEVPLLGERGALEGDQEVHRNGVRIELAQREDDVDQVLVASRPCPRSGPSRRTDRPPAPAGPCPPDRRTCAWCVMSP